MPQALQFVWALFRKQNGALVPSPLLEFSACSVGVGEKQARGGGGTAGSPACDWVSGPGLPGALGSAPRSRIVGPRGSVNAGVEKDPSVVAAGSR